MSARPHCDTWERDPHEPGECLLIFTGQPGRERRRAAESSNPKESLNAVEGLTGMALS